MSKETNVATQGTATVLTKEMIQDVMDKISPPLPTVVLNPNLYVPIDNERTLGELKEAGELPPNILLSKAVPLLTGYEIDTSVLDFASFIPRVR